MPYSQLTISFCVRVRNILNVFERWTGRPSVLIIPLPDEHILPLQVLTLHRQPIDPVILARNRILDPASILDPDLA